MEGIKSDILQKLSASSVRIIMTNFFLDFYMSMYRISRMSKNHIFLKRMCMYVCMYGFFVHALTFLKYRDIELKIFIC